jgi:phospholipid/cholesterol/gamma-HCH transport system substrate-binding protein
MKKFDLELTVGVFLLIGILALGYISVKLGRVEVFGQGGYTLYARFQDAGGIKPGAMVEIAGVAVGKVRGVRLDRKSYLASVGLEIEKGIAVQDDAIASIKTKGIIGEKFIEITPGGSEMILGNGGVIRDTESAVDLEALISKYVFGKV